MSYAPTAKVAAVGVSGTVITLVLQLLQQYVHGFHPPSAATVSLLITVVGSAAGWIVKESKATPPPDPFPPIRPVNPSPPVQVPPNLPPPPPRPAQ